MVIELFIPLTNNVSSIFWRVPRLRRVSSFFLFLFLLFLSWSISMLLVFVFSSISSLLSSHLKLILTWLFFFLDAILRVFSVHLFEKLSFECFGNGFNVHIVAIATSFAASVNILLAFCILEVSDWWKNCTNFFSIFKPTVDVFLSIFCVLFFSIFYIDVSGDMIS